MVDDDKRISDFLEALKKEWRSSPDGIYWHRLWELLSRFARGPDDAPPPPFILAGSGSSNASKLDRLGSQLHWAASHGCLDAALEYLATLDRGHWNTGLPERWNLHSFY